MNIQNTLDYGQFGAITSNREVDSKHVNRLVKAIRENNLLHINPIICNKKMQVVDGQHRLEAATILNVPIYYMVDDKVAKADIATINSNSKNWSVLDYINYHTIEKRPGFDKLSSFLSEHQGFAASTAVRLMSENGKTDSRELKSGFIDISKFDHAVHVANIIKEFRNIIEFAYERNFIMAVAWLIELPDYDHEIMKKKLEYQSRSLVRCVNTQQYKELLVEIYNRQSSKNKLPRP